LLYYNLVEAAGIEPASDESSHIASTGLAFLCNLNSAVQEAQPHCPAPLFSLLNIWCHCLRAAAWVDTLPDLCSLSLESGCLH